MDTNILLTLVGYLITPILIVLTLAVFIHLVLTLHRTREHRAYFFDSFLTTPTLQPGSAPEDTSPV